MNNRAVVWASNRRVQMAKKHSELTGADLHNPKGIGSENTSTALIVSQSTQTISVSGSVIPETTNTYDLGTAAKMWKDIYVSSGSIKFVDPSTNLVVSTIGLDADGNQNISGSVLPDSDATYDLGSSTKEWNNLYIDGTANIDSLTLTSGATVTAVLDEDAMGSDSATALATQQSIKAYVAAQITAEDLDVGSDSGTIAIDLNSETFTIAGGTGITTSATSNTLTIASAVTAGDGLTLTSADIDIDAAQTTITSVLNTGLVVGRDADNDIDFATDNNIIFRAGGEDQLTLVDGALTPSSNAIVDLGTDALEFKDAYFDGTVEADAITIAGVTLSETIADTVGAMVSSNTESDISVTYEDGDNTLDFDIDDVYIRNDGNDTSSGTITAAGFTSTATGSIAHIKASDEISGSISQAIQTGITTAANLTTVGTIGSGTWEGTTIAVDQGGTGVTTSTGTTNVVLSNSPTLVTPALGTPSALVGTNISGTASSLNIGGTAAIGTSITVTANNSADETVYPLFVDGVSGTQGAETDSGLTYNPSTGLLTSTGFSGNLTGTLQTASQTNITSIGTIQTGVWNSTDIGVAYGGTGASNASDARDNLGLTIGSNVQAYDAQLASVAGWTAAQVTTLGNIGTTTTAADKMIYTTAADTFAETAITSFGRSLVDDAAASNARTTLGLGTSAVLNTAAISDGGGGVATADQIHTFVTTQTDSIAANTSGTATTVTVTDDTSNNNWPIVLHDGSNGLLDDTGTFTYNPSTSTLVVPNISVSGTQTFIDTATLVVTSSVIFEGATDDGYETTLTVTDPTADRTWTLQNASDTIVGRDTSDTLTNKTISGASNTLSNIANSSLSNSTISGIALGSNLANLTVDNTTVQLSSGTTYNGGTGLTISGKTAAIANGGSGLATADQIHTFVTTQTDEMDAGTSGNAATATLATTITITDNESTNEENAILFSAGADTDGGSLGVEQDHSGMTYNPSTGGITATLFTGAVTGNSSTATKISSITNSNIVQLTSSQTLTNKTLTTPTIASFTNATHNHSNAAGGGQITLGTGTTGNYVATAVAGDGIDVSGATGNVTISVEDSTASNKGSVIVAGGTGITVGYSAGTATVTGHTKYALTEDLASGEITQLQNIGTSTISAAQWGYLGAATGAITNTNTVDMGDGFKVRDDDNDDVTLTENEYIKFISATGTAGTNLAGAGTTGDPYVMTITSPDTNTDLSTDVTLAGTPDYITISGQTITRNAIVLTTDVSGVLPSANMDADTAHLTTTQTFSGAKTFSSLASFTMDGNTITGIDDSAEFTDDDAHIMTSAAVQDKILGYSYSTTTGTVTNVATAGTVSGITLTGGAITSTGTITLGGTIDLASGDIPNNAADTSGKATTAGTADLATTITITDNESTNEENAILFSAGADVDGGSLGVEQDHSGLTYNPSTGGITATLFTGAVTGNVTGNVTGTIATATQGTIDHDSLANFVADEHVAHGGVSIIAGTGLTGGGTIAATRTLNVVGGDGITANANDVAVTAAQTTITSIINNGLSIGGYSSHQLIDFSTDDMIKVSVNNVADEFRFTAGGTFHADADIVAFSSTVASDRKLKTNITDTKYGLSDVLKLRGVDFNWKEKFEGKRDVGFIAQEVQEIIPEVVKEVDSLKEEGETHLTVDYSKVVPVLIEAIKEQQKQIDELKKNKMNKRIKE